MPYGAKSACTPAKGGRFNGEAGTPATGDPATRPGEYPVAVRKPPIWLFGSFQPLTKKSRSCCSTAWRLYHSTPKITLLLPLLPLTPSRVEKRDSLPSPAAVAPV